MNPVAPPAANPAARTTTGQYSGQYVPTIGQASAFGPFPNVDYNAPVTQATPPPSIPTTPVVPATGGAAGIQQPRMMDGPGSAFMPPGGWGGTATPTPTSATPTPTPTPAVAETPIVAPPVRPDLQLPTGETFATSGYQQPRIAAPQTPADNITNALMRLYRPEWWR